MGAHQYELAAVCAGGVAITFMRERPDLYDLISPRIESAMGCFLSGFREDGVCQEGFAYWCHGFGFFICYAQPCPVMERFATLTKPEINGNTVRIGELSLRFDENWTCGITPEKHTRHAQGQFYIDMFMLDFRPKTAFCGVFTLTGELI